jgi:indolepyruvate ferredoxin oxidoreductase alpha subunit
MILQVDPDRCVRCDSCDLIIGCLGAVVERADRSAVPVIDEESCYACGLCTMICRHGAVVERAPSVSRKTE